MDELLTKARLLEGVERHEQVEIKALGGKVEIRPITSAQWADAQQRIGKGIMLEMGHPSQADGGKAAENNYLSDLLICRFGLVEGWTDAELGHLPAGAVEQISEAVQDLSGISKNPTRTALKAMESFRETEPGASDTPSEQPAPVFESIIDDPFTE